MSSKIPLVMPLPPPRPVGHHVGLDAVQAFDRQQFFHLVDTPGPLIGGGLRRLDGQRRIAIETLTWTSVCMPCLLPRNARNRVDEGDQMLDGAERRAHQRLQPHRVAVALPAHPANLGQPFLERGGGRGRGLEVKERRDLPLETLHIVRRAFDLLA